MNNRDGFILKKIIQYSDEIQATIDRFSLTRDKFAEDFIVKNAIAMCNIAVHNYEEIDVDKRQSTMFPI